ncbi:MAG: hypothetical protein IBX72_08630 [Nitrospirae bacterium]|jgi:hypothetical protein|nr:hypothetical protein [Nitrospirota bacterium]
MGKIFNCPICNDALNSEHYCVQCDRDFDTEVIKNAEGSLTDAQIEQQDYVDVSCFYLIKQFQKDAAYNIEHVAVIRDALIDVLTEFYGQSSYDVYPWLLEPEIKNAKTKKQKPKKKIFVLVKMFQGIHDGIELFWDEKESEKAYRKYTGQDYPQDGDFEEIHEDFRDSIIVLVKIPEK